MRFFRRVAGFLGIVRDNGSDVKEEGEDKLNDSNETNNHGPHDVQETGLPRKGFGVQVQVAVERPLPGPTIVPCTSGNGGVQSLKWYAKHLRIDGDGDVADEFLDEVLPQTLASEEVQNRPLPKFEIRYNTRPVKVKNQVMTPDGKIQQCVEYQGRLHWV